MQATLMRVIHMQIMGMTTNTEATLTSASLLKLMWLASPALPVGGFSYSEGLEAAVESSLVTCEQEACNWLLDQLHLSLARSDLPLLAQATQAWRLLAQDPDQSERLHKLNQWCLQTRETHEMRLQTVQMGHSMLGWLRNQAHSTSDPFSTLTPIHLELCAQLEPTYPLAFALAVSGTQATVHDGLLSYAFGWAENMVQAALKAVPLGQSAGQRILLRLSQELPSVAHAACILSESERQAFSPMLAILSSQHETQYSRLFRS